MHGAPILVELFATFVAALAVLVVSHRFRLPAVVGFLVTGMLIGPAGLAIVGRPAHVELMAELGVVLLLFVVGLEISPAKLRRLGRAVLIGGSLQTGLTIAAAAGTALVLGLTLEPALFLGFVVALSSTALVLKLFTDGGDIEAPHGQIALGILLFQDLVVVPMLLVTPLLAAVAGPSPTATLLELGRSVAVLTVGLALAWWLLPRLLEHLARTRIRELTVLGSLCASFGMALLTQALGLSMGLGGFLAGLVLADSAYRHHVLSETAAFRDVLGSLFFISIGMLFVWPSSLESAGLLLLATLVLAIGKGLLAAIAVLLMRFPLRTAIGAALALAHLGELSFLLIEVGHRNSLLDDELRQLLVAIGVLSMLATPLLIRIGPHLAHRLGRQGQKRSLPEPPTAQVLIAGYGLNGRHLARVLREAGISVCAVDLDPERVERARQDNVDALFGDATRLDILRAAGIERARVAVIGLSDAVATRAAVRLIRALRDDLHLVARVRAVGDIEELRECGADEVIVEELESSIELVRRVLGELRLPPHLVRAAARVLRSDQYDALLSPALRTGLSQTLLSVVAAGVTDSFPLAPGHPAIGQTLRELDLRRHTGAMVLAVLRADDILVNPDPSLPLETGDTLAIVGNHSAVAAAVDHLEELALATEV